MVQIPSGCHNKMNNESSTITKIYALILIIYPIVIYVISSYLFKLANLSMYNQINNSWWLFPLPHMINVLCILILYSKLKQIKRTKFTTIILAIYIILLGCPIWALFTTSLNLNNIFSFLLGYVNFDNMSVILEMFVFYCFVFVNSILKRKKDIFDDNL